MNCWRENVWKRTRTESKKCQSIARKSFKVNSKRVFQFVKGCPLLCQQNLCSPEDIRNKFGSFDFTDNNALELWEYLEPVIGEFQGMLRNIAWISIVYSTKTCYHKMLKDILLLPISCYLKLQIIFCHNFPFFSYQHWHELSSATFLYGDQVEKFLIRTYADIRKWFMGTL